MPAMRRYYSAGDNACSQSGAITASSFKAARIVSPTRSSRLRMRTAARTWVESVRCRPVADQSEFTASVQEGVEELQFGLAVDQAGAELAEHGVVEAGIGKFQGEGVLPVDPPADGVGGLAVGEAFDVLENANHGDPSG